MVTDFKRIADGLWSVADQLNANSGLKPSEYATPVLGLLFLRYADAKFAAAEKELATEVVGGWEVGKLDYQARGVLYLPPESRYAGLLALPEGADIGKAVNQAMAAIERENEEVRGVLPQQFTQLSNATLVTLLKQFSTIQLSAEGDIFGNVFEYFLGKFALSEGAKGGVFFTPTSLVQLIVEVIEPFHGRIFDPACGSCGMFVQSAEFVRRHKLKPNDEISIFGQEKTAESVRLGKMNLAVHGLSGDIREGNSYYEDIHESLGQFDFVMANPPFNVSGVDKTKLGSDKRFPFGMPRSDVANYLWIQHFYSALNETGRAGFVMANSASDARGSEQEIRRQLLQAGAIDVMISIGPNFFYTVTLPCTLWFFDRGKRGTERADKVLFIDARMIFTQVDRAHRDFTPAQLEFVANIARLYRGESPETDMGSAEMMRERFPDGVYRDVAGLCKVAALAEIEAQGWSLNPGRYVGVTARGAEEFVFAERLEELNEDLELLNTEALSLQETISVNVALLLENTA